MSQYYLTQEDYLQHHGVKGQKWGQRQYQNEDGSLTALGREHYGYGARAEYKNRIGLAKTNYKNTKNAINTRVQKGEEKIEEKYASGQRLTQKDLARQEKLYADAKREKQAAKDAYKAEKKAAKEAYKNSDEYKARQEKMKKAAIAGAAIVGTALVAYGAYKLSQANKTKAFEAAAKEGERKVRELTRSYESAKKSVEYAKSVGGGSGRNEHYKWNVDKNGYYSISQLSDREIAKDNATAAAKYNAEVAKEKYRNAKDGFYNVTYRKAVGYDPRKNK